MLRKLMRGKIHRATVTQCDPDYVGSITIDADLLRAADIRPNEAVLVLDIDNAVLEFDEDMRTVGLGERGRAPGKSDCEGNSEGEDGGAEQAAGARQSLGHFSVRALTTGGSPRPLE